MCADVRLPPFMSRRLSTRLTTTLFVVLSLLFSQLALANYVCPQQAEAAAMAEMMASGMPCEGMDAEQPTLCAQFSASAPQSPDTAKTPTLAASIAVQVLVLPFKLLAGETQSVPLTARPQARPPPGPLFLSTLRLRV